MSRGAHSGSKPVYCADFETIDRGESVAVWAWAAAEHGEIAGYGTTMAGFFAFMAMHDGIYYFHNLKFDGSFVVNYLLSHGYTWQKERATQPKTFSTLITDDGSWYTITIPFEEHSVELRDSLKKIPLPVAAIPAAFALPEIAKGEIDYTAPRPEGYVPSDDEWEYVFNDVRIVSMAMSEMYSEGLTGLTQSADTLEQFKSTQGKSFRTLFPQLDEEADAYLRAGYRGGFTYADPRFSGRLHEIDGIVVDANSMYPSVMHDEPLPYGEGEWVEEMPDGLWVGRMYLELRAKDDHIPCWSETRTVRFGDATEYLTELEGEFTLCSADWELIQEQYDVLEAVFVDGYSFKSARGMFDEHIDHWYGVKRKSKGGRRFISKIMLNALYGKFGTRPKGAQKRPYLEEGVLKFKRQSEDDRETLYLPIAIFTTSYARRKMIRAAQANYKYFAYCDTDSMHLLTDEVHGVEVHDSKLGAWKVEGRFSRAVYRRAKCYAETMGDHMDVHIAGLPRKLVSQVTYDGLLNGAEIRGKLVPRQVPGGVRLVETTFTIK